MERYAMITCDEKTINEYQNDENTNVGWKQEGGFWYYLDADGDKKKGWQYIGSDWFYLGPETKIMITGWKELNGNRYYFDSDERWFMILIRLLTELIIILIQRVYLSK